MIAAGQARGERGIILIAVLLSVAIMAVIVVAAAALTRAGIGSEQLDQRRMATHFALRSGLEAAKAAILASEPEDRLFFNGEPVTLDVGQGILITASIRDAGSFLDLNRSDPAIIEAAARIAGLEGAEVNGLGGRIAGLREDAKPEDDKAPATAAAKAPAQPPQPGAPPAPDPAKPAAAPPPEPVVFLSAEQIGELVNTASKPGKAFAANLTVFNPTGKINPLTAPDDVLNAIPNLTRPDRAVIAGIRQARSGASDARLQQILQRTKDHLSLAEPRVFIIELRLEQGPRLLAGSESRAVVMLSDGALPFRTLAAGGE